MREGQDVCPALVVYQPVFSVSPSDPEIGDNGQRVVF